MVNMQKSQDKQHTSLCTMGYLPFNICNVKAENGSLEIKLFGGWYIHDS